MLDVDVDIRVQLQETAEIVNRALANLTARWEGYPPRLAEAMRYSLHGVGKRLRPALVLWSCEACGGVTDRAMPAALAIECVHTFSLIHDDLPALDNDDYRRGQPTNHYVFGEAMAILAGDSLLALSFETLAREVADPGLATRMVRELSEAAGGGGMIGGEALDLAGESQPSSAALVEQVHSAKTARLIQAACRLGAISAGADEAHFDALSAYGHALGLAFQATDDLLDVTGSLRATGKRTGKDVEAGKQTYPRAVGVEETRRLAEGFTERAIAALTPLGAMAAKLSSLARYALDRSR